jgi:polar amino acid transport system substrate-binding protein
LARREAGGQDRIHRVTRALVCRLLVPAVLALALSAGCAPEQVPPLAAPLAPPCPPGGLSTLDMGTLTVATDQPVYPPWYVDDDPANGKGFESAVAYAVADKLGYAKSKVKWVRVPFNAAIQPGPKTYDLDLTEYSITPERKAAVDFSTPYYDVKQAVVTIEGNPAAKVTSLADLKKVRLGAQVGTTSYQTIIDEVAPVSPPAVFNSNDDAKLALTNDQVDAIVVDLPTAFYITSAELDNGKVVGQLPASASGTPEQFGIVMDSNSPLTHCVSDAVDALRDDGTLAKLEKQWLATEGTAPELS